MRYLLSILVMGLLTISGCSKQQDGLLPDGHYAGTFRRISAGVGDTAYVAINFSGNQFEGAVNSTPQQNYPAICKGTYKLDGSTIQFSNQCFFTANFDWSLILNNNYELIRNNDSLTIIRDYNGIFRDEYRLLRLKR